MAGAGATIDLILAQTAFIDEKGREF